MNVTITLTKAEAQAVLRHPAPNLGHGVRQSKTITTAWNKIQTATHQTAYEDTHPTKDRS
jgi:hypothetical protein